MISYIYSIARKINNFFFIWFTKNMFANQENLCVNLEVRDANIGDQIIGKCIELLRKF